MHKINKSTYFFFNSSIFCVNLLNFFSNLHLHLSIISVSIVGFFYEVSIHKVNRAIYFFFNSSMFYVNLLNYFSSFLVYLSILQLFTMKKLYINI
jgi:hypothetical protein